MSQPTILGRKPDVPNKYNLTPEDLNHLELLDKRQVKDPLFWRNNVINAWCISYENDDIAGDEFWLGIYDKPFRNRLIHVHFSAYGGMCNYNFTKFYDPHQIDNIYDLDVQEHALKILNDLIDRGIIAVHKPSGKRVSAK